MPNAEVSASSAAAAPSIAASSSSVQAAPEGDKNDSNAIKIVFSDLDGTLIHYPDTNANGASEKNQQQQQQVLRFPPSSTGLRGIISTRTLSAVDEIRNHNQVKFVLVSGMRTSTLLRRLPYLPRADAYCSENGGRIFYPIGSDKDEDEDDDVFWVKPKNYKHNFGVGNGGNPHRNTMFGIKEDKAWRTKMEAIMGGDSYGDFSLQELHDAAATEASVPLHERDGILWDFARDLIHTHGLVLDMEGYATCFRVNQKQQDQTTGASKFHPEKIRALLDAPEWEDNRTTLSSSVNLKCVDFYPSCSGKKNCCLYLASKFFPEDCQKDQATSEGEGDDTNTIDTPEEDDKGSSSNNSSSPEEDFLSKNAVCLCDDDNDLEMALACHHAYLPSIASESMEETIQKFPDHFTKTFRNNNDTEEALALQGTDASDVALLEIYQKTANELEKPKKSMTGARKLGLVLCSFVLLFLV